MTPAFVQIVQNIGTASMHKVHVSYNFISFLISDYAEPGPLRKKKCSPNVPFGRSVRKKRALWLRAQIRVLFRV